MDRYFGNRFRTIHLQSLDKSRAQRFLDLPWIFNRNFNSFFMFLSSLSVPEMTYENNAATCTLLYTQQSARVYNCKVGRPWKMENVLHPSSSFSLFWSVKALKSVHMFWWRSFAWIKYDSRLAGVEGGTRNWVNSKLLQSSLLFRHSQTNFFLIHPFNPFDHKKLSDLHFPPHRGNDWMEISLNLHFGRH
jgi:hypothetical protein